MAALYITLYLGNYFWVRDILHYIWTIIFGCIIYYAIFGQLFLAALYITLYLGNYFWLCYILRYIQAINVGCIIYYAIFEQLFWLHYILVKDKPFQIDKNSHI